MSTTIEGMFVPDDDDLSVNPTPASSPRSHYALEAILAERVGDNGVKEYLVKWEDYPLHRSTWEPEENFSSDKPMWEWEDTKARIARGLESAFALNDYYRSVDEESNRVTQLYYRRRQKRIKNNLSVTPEPVESEGGDSEAFEIADSDPGVENWPSEDERRLLSKHEGILKKGLARPKKTRDQRRRKVCPGVSPMSTSSDSDSGVEDSPAIPRKKRRVMSSDLEDEPYVASPDSVLEEHQASVNQQSCKASVDYSSLRNKDIIGRKASLDSSQNLVLAKEATTPILQKKSRSGSATGAGTIHIPKKSTSFSLLSGILPRRSALMNKVVAEEVVSSPTRVTKRTVNNLSKPKGAGIFASWDAPRKKKGRTRLGQETANANEVKNFRTLSQRHRLQEYGRNEPPPNPEHLNFIDLNQNKPFHQAITEAPPGQVALEAQQGSVADATNRPSRNNSPLLPSAVERQSSPGFVDLADDSDNDSSPVPPSLIEKEIRPSPTAGGFRQSWGVVSSVSPNLSDPPATNQDSINSTCDLTQSIGEAIFSMLGPSTEGFHDSTVASSALAEPMLNASAPWTGKPPMTCRRWKIDGSCPYSDSQCPLQHRSLPLVEPVGGPPPKFRPQPQTCDFWYKKKSCHFTPEQCRYAHWNTGLLGNRFDPQNPIPISKSADAQPLYIPRILKTCYFWKTNGRCMKSDRECSFAHFQCDEDADPPGSWRELVHTSVAPRTGIKPADDSTDSSPPSTRLESILQQDTMGEHVMATLCVPMMQESLTILQVLMLGMELGVKNEFLAQTGNNPKFLLKHMCMSEDYRHHVISRKPTCLAKGEISPIADTKLEDFVQNLKLHSSAALYYHQNFTMTIYPADEESWKFLPTNRKTAPEVKLRFYIHTPVSQPLALPGPAASLTRHSLSEAPVLLLFREVIGITPEGLFTWRDGKTNPIPIERNVFLMIPPCYADELMLLEKFFAACKAKVSTIGSWGKFSNQYKSSGVVLFHPTFFSYHKLANLQKFLVRGFRWNMFRLGCLAVPSATPTGLPLLPSNTISITKLFPNGGIFLLTDDVLASHPLSALVIILKFVETNRTKRPEQQNWRLVGRPGLVHWVRQLAFERRDRDLFQIHEELERLPSSLDSAKRADSPINVGPTQPPLVVSPDPEVMSEYADTWENDPVRATEWLVEWYAGWLLDQVEIARKFYVVYSTAEWAASRDWKERYQHLDVLSMDKFATTTWSDVEIDGAVMKRMKASVEGTNREGKK